MPYALNPPSELLEAYQAKDDEALGQMFDLMFAYHDYLEDETAWEGSTTARLTKRRYEEGTVSPRLLQIAPDWDAAIAMAKKWLDEWKHDYVDAEGWWYRQDELDDPKALRYFEVMTKPNS